jgi:hypothetical protein
MSLTSNRSDSSQRGPSEQPQTCRLRRRLFWWLAVCAFAAGCRDEQSSSVANAFATPAAEVASPVDPPSEAWQQQLLAVERGESDTILVEDQPISDRQLAQLAGVSDQLEQLLVDAGGLTDASLGLLAPLQKLTHLRIRESPISDAGVARLVDGHPDQLRILNIPQGSVTAEGIKQLAKLPNLVQLRLGGEQLDDLAVEAISKLPKLRALHLIGPRLSAKSLDYLATAPRLSSLYIDDCPLPDEAWVRLFEAKPKLHVHIDQQHHDRDPNAHSEP